MFLTDLFEAPLKPGERKAVELKIANVEQQMRQIQQYKAGMERLNKAPKLPGTEKELDELLAEYQKLIDQLQAKLNDSNQNSQFDKFMAGVVKNCPTVIAAYKKTDRVLYRGTNMDSVAFYGKPYDDRYAKDSMKDYSRAFNKALEQAGVVARRDNSVFCTTSKSLALNFGGKLYIIFPRDPIHFTWSNKVKDLVLASDNLMDMVSDETVRHALTPIFANPELKQSFIKRYEKLTYSNVGGDIPFDPNTYSRDNHNYLNKYTFQTIFNIMQEMIWELPEEYRKYGTIDAWVDPKSVITNFGLHFDDDFAAAMNEGNEITVRAEYYALEAKLEAKIRNYLEMNPKNDPNF